MEDLSPFMIPAPPGMQGIQPTGQSDARNRFDGVEPFFKSASATTNSPELEELMALLTTITNTYLANFKIDARIPYPMRQNFNREMELVSQQLAKQAATSFHNAIAKGYTPNRALSETNAVVESGMGVLSAKLNRFDLEFSTWLTLESLHRQGYTRYLFLSERGSTTCERCQSYHGQIFSIMDTPMPPIHAHCRCELLVMDARMEAIYRSNSQGFLDAFRWAREGAEGGIHLLDHDAFPLYINAEHLTRVSLPSGQIVLDASRKGNGKFDLAAAAKAYFEWLAADATDLVTYFLNAQENRGKKKWNSFGGFLDWLTLGIVSGTWRGFADRHETMVANPNLYNIVNALTAGALDTLAGAFAPEEPFSLEHLLNIVGTALIAYAGYQIAVGVKDLLTGQGDDALRAAGSLADDVDDIVRGAGLTQAQIDDIINLPKGQRPDPGAYLTQEYISNHLAQFKGGVTKIQASLTRDTIGPPQGTYVLPTSVADDLIARANGDIKALEDFLCLERGDLGDAPIRVDISHYAGLRMPRGTEPGANINWMPGGYTPRGVPEAVIDQVQPGNYTVSSVFN